MEETVEDGIQELCKKLSATKLDNEIIVADIGQLKQVLTKGTNYLVMKLHTSRPYNRVAFKTTMKKVWRLARSLHFHDLGMGLMLVEFENKANKKCMTLGWD